MLNTCKVLISMFCLMQVNHAGKSERVLMRMYLIWILMIYCMDRQSEISWCKFHFWKKVSVDISPIMRNAAANAILSHCKYASEFTKRHVLESYIACSNIIVWMLYFYHGFSNWNNSCGNSVYRKIFILYWN